MVNSSGDYVGYLCAFAKKRNESSFYKTELPFTTLHISSLEIFPKYWGKGYGSDFIDFAKKESYKQGCAGKVSLVAFYPGRPPHLFYFKKGFITPNKKVNEAYEKHAKNGGPFYYCNAIDMFLPLKTEHLISKNKNSQTSSPKKTIKDKILSFMNLFFNNKK